MGKNSASNIEMARFCSNLTLLKNCARYYLDPEPELSEVGTGTALNHYGSTTLIANIFRWNVGLFIQF